MVSVPSQRLGFEKPAQGDYFEAWASPMAQFIEDLDDAIAGAVTITTVGGTRTLSTTPYAANEARMAGIIVQGVLAANASIVVPAREKNYFVENRTTGPFSVVINASGASIITVPQGRAVILRSFPDTTLRVLSAFVNSLTGLIEIDGLSPAALAALAVGVLGPNVITTVMLQNDSVTPAKMSDLTGVSVLGNPALAAGDPMAITALFDGASLVRAGNTLGFALAAARNVAARGLSVDTLNPAVISRTTNTPPGGPTDGNIYYVPTVPAPVGGWAGQGGKLARWDALAIPAAWVFTPLVAGDHFWVNDEAKEVQFDGIVLDVVKSKPDDKSVDLFTLNLRVKDRDLTVPPGAPVDGDTYIVAVPGAGAWLGQDNNVAKWDAAALTWLFRPAEEGLIGWLDDENAFVRHDGTAWGPLAASGNAPFSSVRATSSAPQALSGLPLIDNLALVAGDRILLTGQVPATQNGIYVIAAGAWLRAADADATAEITTGRMVFVSQGDTQAGKVFAVTSADPHTIGTTPIAITQFSNPVLLDFSVTEKKIADAAVRTEKIDSRVKDKDLTAPPPLVAGERYIVAAVATGAWLLHENEIAVSDGVVWSFITPIEGMTVWADDEDAVYKFDGTIWSLLVPPVSGVTPWGVARLSTAVNVVVATGGLLMIDGIATVAGDRVVLVGQTDPKENGIYTVAPGAWTRTGDADVDAEFLNGKTVFVAEGATNAGKTYAHDAPIPTVLGTTNVDFVVAATAVVPDNSVTKTKIVNSAVKTEKIDMRVKDRDLSTPPGAPADGDRYLVATGGLAAWAGQDGRIAEWNALTSVWDFKTNVEGMIIWLDDENLFLKRTDSIWNELVQTVSAPWATVKAVSTTNVVIATGTLIAVDGYTPIVGDRILLIGQTDPKENGIYTAAVAAWVRATDADANIEFPHTRQVFVSGGTSDKGKTYYHDAPVTAVVLGTSNIAFVEFTAPTSGAGSMTPPLDPVTAALTTNINLATPGATIDGRTMVAGERFGAFNQTTPAENGIYLWNGAAVAATRASDADATAEIVTGRLVQVQGGLLHKNKTFSVTSADPHTVGTSTITFTQKFAQGSGVSIATSIYSGKTTEEPTGLVAGDAGKIYYVPTGATGATWGVPANQNMLIQWNGVGWDVAYAADNFALYHAEENGVLYTFNGTEMVPADGQSSGGSGSTVGMIDQYSTGGGPNVVRKSFGTNLVGPAAPNTTFGTPIILRPGSMNITIHAKGLSRTAAHGQITVQLSSDGGATWTTSGPILSSASTSPIAPLKGNSRAYLSLRVRDWNGLHTIHLGTLAGSSNPSGAVVFLRDNVPLAEMDLAPAVSVAQYAFAATAGAATLAANIHNVFTNLAAGLGLPVRLRLFMSAAAGATLTADEIYIYHD